MVSAGGWMARCIYITIKTQKTNTGFEKRTHMSYTYIVFQFVSPLH